MAISSELIGTLGAGDSEVTHSRIFFSTSNRPASEINETWNVPRGNYLFTWNASLSNNYSSNSKIFINGQLLIALPANTIGDQPTGGFVILDNVATISVIGEGTKRFTNDPYVALVKVK